MGAMARTLEELVAEMTQLQRSLPPRPSLDQVDSAREVVAKVDSALGGRLEAVMIQHRPEAIPQPVFRAYQEMREDVLRCQAQAEKRMAMAVLELEERHRRFDSLLLKVHATVVSLHPPVITAAGPSSDGNGAPSDLGAILDEKILHVLGNASAGADANAMNVGSSAGNEKSVVRDWGKDLSARLDKPSANHVALDLAVSPHGGYNGNVVEEPLPKYVSPRTGEPAEGKTGGVDKNTLSLAPLVSISVSSTSGGFEPMSTIHEDGAAGACPPNLVAVLESTVENAADSLILKDAELAWLPDSIGLLMNLKVLNLAKNQLESLPESIGDLKQLTILDVSSNKLRALPEGLGRLSKLQKLNIMKNGIEELPWTIGGCYSLEELRADFNHLKALPEAVGHLISLRILSVHLNSIIRLPTTMSSLTNLQELDVHFNHLEALPESVCSLPNLVRLDVSSNFNELKALPQSIGNLQRLQELDISFNHITVLPDSFAQLTNLRELKLDGNPFQVPPLEVAHQGKKAVLDYMRRHVEQKQGSDKNSRRGGVVLKFALFVLGLLKRSRKKKAKELANSA